MSATFAPDRSCSLGGTRQKPDLRDVPFTCDPDILGGVRAGTIRRIDLSASEEMPEVWDQGDLSSCAAHAVAAAWEFTARKQGLAVGTPSRLFIWYTGRTRAANDDSDGGIQGANSGITIRQALKAVHGSGAPPEDLWPYDPEKFARKPPRAVYAAARQHTARKYSSVTQTLDELKGTLASGFPILFYHVIGQKMKEEDSEGDYTYDVLPEDCTWTDDEHAGLIVGFDDDENHFKVRDSRGPFVGDGGYVLRNYQFVLSSKASDFWVIDKVS